jgi:hypothetical protein
MQLLSETTSSWLFGADHHYAFTGFTDSQVMLLEGHCRPDEPICDSDFRDIRVIPLSR